MAGILGLGVAAASGGLGLAAASVTTIALLSISGGFAAASFAAIDNQDLAKIYTIAANRVDAAFKDAAAQLKVSNDKRYDDKEACGRALVTLKQGLWEARTMLEQARTNSAVAALVRAREERKVLDEVIAGAQDADPTRITLNADIESVTPGKVTKGQATEMTLKVVSIRLDRVALADVKVMLGTKEIDLSARPTPQGSGQTSWDVEFTASAQPPNPSQADYAPFLLVGKSKQRVGSQSGQKLTYQP